MSAVPASRAHFTHPARLTPQRPRYSRPEDGRWKTGDEGLGSRLPSPVYRLPARLSARRLQGDVVAAMVDRVDQAVLLGVFGLEDVVAVRVFRDLVHRLAGVLREKLVDALALLQHVLGVDLDV